MIKTYIIAEISSNHDGDLDRALILTNLAKMSGADAVKFQYFRADNLVKRRGADPFYQVYKDNEVTDFWFDALYDEARHLGLEFLCTAYDREGLEVVNPWVEKHKVSSFESRDHDYLRAIRETGKPVILSTGMMDIRDLIQATDILGEACWAILHCTSAYPAPMEEANLRVIADIDDMCSRVGLSDHTQGITAPVAAVALGATVIEKHFTDERSREGPDHKVSIEPMEFREMVRMIREVEVALGDGVKKAQPSELTQYAVVKS